MGLRTADSLLECCILLKSKKGLSPPHGTDIWAKYLGLFFRYPVGKTLSGRQKVACSVPQGGRGPRSSQGEQEGRGGHGGTCLQVEFSKASLISSSLELALLLLPVEYLYWLYFLFSAEGTLSIRSSLGALGARRSPLPSLRCSPLLGPASSSSSSLSEDEEVEEGSLDTWDTPVKGLPAAKTSSFLHISTV